MEPALIATTTEATTTLMQMIGAKLAPVFGVIVVIFLFYEFVMRPQLEKK